MLCFGELTNRPKQAHMILVIDNYDSFTYNLVQYLGELGADVVVRRNDALSVDEVGAMNPSAIVLSPGPCTPKEAGITVEDLDHVAYSYAPDLYAPEDRWDPLFITLVRNAREQLVDGAPHHLQSRLRSRGDPAFAWHFVPHHLAHEASAFLAAPFDECAVLTMDGRGEDTSTTYGVFADGRFSSLGQVALPHSLGLLYEEITDFLGFLRSSDEYKVMALASYGKPAYVAALREIVRSAGGGQYTVQRGELQERFGPPRKRGAPVTQREFDIAHSLQQTLEETALDMVHWLHGESRMRDLAMAGGVALNCVMNAAIRDRGPFRNVWVQPAAGDAGTALGAALWTDYNERGRPPQRWRMDHAYLGPAFDDDEIQQFLDWSKCAYRHLDDVPAETAQLLAQGKVIGWFQGRMEFGPRALGARSILASPIDPAMQSRLNEIKDREDFRPVAPVVLEEDASEWFENATIAPYMLFVFRVREDKAARIPAVRHVDGTARVQTINRGQHALYYDLLRAFKARTGVPVLVNTSFNTRGEPIVCTPRDAVESYFTSPLDALVIGRFCLEKSPAP